MICDGDYGAPLLYIDALGTVYQIGLAGFIYNHSPDCKEPVCGCVNMQGSHIFLFKFQEWLKLNANVKFENCQGQTIIRPPSKMSHKKLSKKNKKSRATRLGVDFNCNLLAILFVELSVFLTCKGHFIWL